MKKNNYLVISLLVITLLLSGCGLLKSGQQGGKTEQKNQTKEKVKIGYVQWASAEASTYLVKEVLERVGYVVETPVLQAGAMFEGLARGDIDAIVCAWLPKTHKSYWEKRSDKLVDLGANFNGAKIGLVVPSYVEANNISELKNYSKGFNNQIVGIDPGAGIMEITENKVMPAYDLNDWKLAKTSGPAMTASLKKAIDNKKAIVVTGWTPHWMWAEFDLKYLQDSKGAYGEAESIKSLGRKEIKSDLPEVAQILENYKLTTQQLGEVMNMIQDGSSPEEAARKFVDDNLELINSWLPKGEKIIE